MIGDPYGADFSTGKIGGGGLAAASRAGVALRPTSRTHAPSVLGSPDGTATKKAHHMVCFFIGEACGD